MVYLNKYKQIQKISPVIVNFGTIFLFPFTSSFQKNNLVYKNKQINNIAVKCSQHMCLKM